MSREVDPRIKSAFNAMKSLGISPDIVKPVLKKLLKLYNKNWDLIEDENYRTLADAIFESMEDQAKSSGTVTHDDPEPPPKKPHRAVPEDQVSSTMDNGNILSQEEGEIPQTSSASKLRDLKQRGSNNSGSSQSAVVAQQQPPCHDKRRPFCKIFDITNGTEKVSIPLLDETGREQLPSFIYIPENIVYQSAYVHVSLARIADCCSSCRGDCLSSSVPCACARETGGEFAYTTGGLLKEEFLRACISMNQEPQKHYHYYCQDCPLERAKNGYRPEKCKGHLLRKFIKECWRKCGCSMRCGNRVVQRGISRRLQVFSTREGKGWGLRTLEELPEGAFVCEYVGEILTNMELYERNQRNSEDRHTYPVLLDADWGSEGVLKDEEALCLDATSYGNVARFINHRCYDANLLEIPVEVENPDHHYYHIAFFTKRKVAAMEELTWDYAIDFDDHNHPVKAFKCCCGSKYCRDKKGKVEMALNASTEKGRCISSLQSNAQESKAKTSRFSDLLR